MMGRDNCIGDMDLRVRRRRRLQGDENAAVQRGECSVSSMNHGI